MCRQRPLGTRKLTIILTPQYAIKMFGNGAHGGRAHIKCFEIQYIVI